MTDIIVVAAGAVATGILRPVYREAFGRQVGLWSQYTVSETATELTREDVVLIDDLVDSEDTEERYARRYLYVRDGDEIGAQRRVHGQGYDGPAGALVVTRGYEGPLRAGTSVEVTAPLPSEQMAGIQGLNQYLNQGFAACTIEYRLSLTGNGTRSLSLRDYESFIDQNDRVDAIFDSTAFQTGQPLEPSPYGARIDTSGAERTLVTDYTYADGQALAVRVLRQGHTLVRSSGVWGSSTVGLTSDDQAAAVPVRWAVAAAMCKALTNPLLADVASGPNGLSYWRAVFARIAREQFPQPTPKRRSGRPIPVATVIGPWSMP